MFCDFRLRPPVGDFLGTAQYNLERNARIAASFGMYQAESTARLSMDLFLAEMDAAEISLGVMPGRYSEVFGNVSCASLRAIMAAYPGRFAAFAGVDPLDMPSAFEIIDSEVMSGPFAGINIEPLTAHRAPLFAVDRRIYPIYERAQECAIPVMIMTGGIPDVPIDYTHPRHVENVAVDFPSLTIITPHGCWPHARELIRVCLLRENVYLSPDIYSMGLPGYMDYIQAGTTFLQDRFLYGSAHPTLPMEGCAAFFRSLNIREDVLRKICRENALRVLNQKEEKAERR